MPSDKIIVWEGEWPRLRAAVTTARVSVCEQITTASGYLPEQWKGVDGVPAMADELVMATLSWSKTKANEHPWFFPTAGLSTMATVVFAQSFSKGMHVAVRRSVLATGCAAVLLYPHQAKVYVAELMRST